MSVMSLTHADKFKYRSIIYHGKNSMTDMGLMMIGSTPLSQLTPKSVREEIAYADGDLDLSEVDGEVYFEEREITYTFISIEDYVRGMEGKPALKNRLVTNFTNDIYEWAYKQNVSSDIYRSDVYDGVEPGSPFDELLGVLAPNEMYDYGYGVYKFTGVSKPTIQVQKGMFNNVWVEQLSMTFKFSPYVQSYKGDRVELAVMADRSITSRNTQAMIKIFNNDAYYINDQIRWFDGHADGSMLTGTTWRFKIRVQYSGQIGMYLAPTATWNGVTYTVTSAEGLTWLDNDHPGQTFNTHPGGYGYATPAADSSGYKYITLTVTFNQSYTADNPPHIYVEWGVLRQFDVPDQDNYYVDAYTKSTATMYVNDVETSFATKFSLPERPINEIHVRNTNYDGLYKWRYDTTTRRLC